MKWLLLLFFAIPTVSAVALIGTGSGIVFWEDYVSDYITACHYFQGNGTGTAMLVNDTATPTCPILYKVGGYPECPGGSQLPEKSCQSDP